ncbi:MAG: lipoate--protein ligase family protein [Promethearchaeota archaeon]|nr:MAG: lipoate--protein ligase family protein [Candidatus Lokiarchaeota archaeon]
MKAWRFIPLETRNGFWNMALDEAILKAVLGRKAPNTIRFYKWKPSTASIGRNQSLSNEIDMNFALKNGFNVVRRITGGGAVFHDKDREITYSIVCPIKFLESCKAKKVIQQFEIITQGIIAGLRIYGLNAEKGIIHCPALFLDGKKFSGNAQVRRSGYLLQHGTILLDIDPELMYSVLTPPQNVTKSRMVQSVRAKCIGIKDQLKKYNEAFFITSLKEGFQEVLQIELNDGYYSDYELKKARQLVKEKYSNSKWLNKYE